MKKIREKYRYSTILLRELVRTDFKLRYEDSALGMLWSALKPLMLFTVMYVVFVHFLKMGNGIPHYPVSLLLGIVLWTFFAETTGMGMRAIVENGGLLRKIKIPKSVVVVSRAMSALINLGINLLVVLVFAVLSGVQFRWTALLLVPLVVELFIFALAVAFLLAALYVKFRDLAHIWEVIMQALFYATPIIYPLSMVINMSPLAAKALLFNPVAQVIQDARSAVTYAPTDTIWSLVNNPLIQIAPLLIAAAITTVSILYFRKASRRFTELV
ncbi:ABC transporter permease [Candidatus Saccharibacteria bacterium]|nr:ABC transporter permease [Candidatus Saccharibacteria bacterium]